MDITARPRALRASSSRSRTGSLRSRMLAAAALAGAATLVAGCGIQSDPGAPSAPSMATGADPVPLSEEVLAGSGLFDSLGDAGIVVRWIEPGASLAVVLGGSGGGGECIPQPHAAEAPTGAGAIVVPFDPPNPDVACTMDFRLHGWELALAEPVDAAGIVPVQLVNSAGDEGVIDLELGPDDLLEAGPTADPQPSVIDDGSAPGEPTEIPREAFPDDVFAGDGGPAVLWDEPGTSLAVFFGTNGVPECSISLASATVTGPGQIEVAFNPPTEPGTYCAAVGIEEGWRIDLDETTSATMPVDVTITGATDDGSPITRTLEPGDVLDGD